MKQKILILIFNILLFNISYSQIGIDDFKSIVHSKVDEVDSYMSNHQFEFKKHEYDENNNSQYTWTKNSSSNGKAYKFFIKIIDSKNSNNSMVILQTSDFIDYQKIKSDISTMGFKLENQKANSKKLEFSYSDGNYHLNTTTQVDDDNLNYYVISFFPLKY